MTTKNQENSLTLGQIQDILNTPQHVLIHLCEKGVITPDFFDTDGRGRSRQFSRQNLLEFAIALHIRKFQIPVVAVKAVIALLRKFEKKVQEKVDNFSLLNINKTHPKFIVYVEEGEDLIFSLKTKNNSLLLKCPIASIEQKKSIHFVTLSKLSNDCNSRLEINISKILENLSKKLLL